MAITQVGSAVTGKVAASSLTLNVPTGVADGDFMTLQFLSDGNALSTLTGWTLWNATGTPNTGRRQSTFWRVASSEPASYTITPGAAGNCEGMMMAFTGVDGTTQQDATAVAANAFNSITFSSITSVTDNALHLLLLNDWTTASGCSTPTGYTQVGVSTTRCIAWTKTITPAGTISGVTATNTGNDGRQLVALLRPAGGAAAIAIPVIDRQFRQRWS